MNLQFYLDNVTKFTDRNLLKQYIEKYQREPERVVLLGFTDYAKHLVNIFGSDGQILAIVDLDPAKQGWSYRSVPVIPLDEAFDLEPEHFICTSVNGWAELVGVLHAHPRYRDEAVSFIYPRSEYPNVQPWKDLSFYRSLAEETKILRFERMMPDAPFLFLLEVLRTVIHLPGDVMEIGVWQGGSAFGLGRVMQDEGYADKKLVLIDLFEKMPAGMSRGVMCFDEIKSKLSIFDFAELYQENLVDSPDLIDGRKFCFIHYDLHYIPEILEVAVRHLVPGGIMMLDNFALGAKDRVRFIHWFESNNLKVIHTGHSQQGMVINNRG